MSSDFPLPALPRSLTLKRALLALVLVPILTFALSLQNGFVEWDDPGLITENPMAQSLTPANVKSAFTRYDPELYIPLTFLSYQVDSTIGGVHPFIFHLHNLALHVTSVVLVAWLIFLLTGDVLTAVFCGLLFAVHPLQVESVVWASARKDLLSTLWFLVSIVSYLYARKKNSGKLFVLSLAAFVLALMAKVMVATLPLVLLLIEWRYRNTNLLEETDTSGTLKRLAPYFGLSVLFGLIALFGKKAFVAAASPVAVLLMAGKAVTFSITKTIFPGDLSVLYPYTDPITFANPELLGSLAVAVLLTVAAWILSKKWKRDVWFGWLWFLLCLSPTFLLYRKGEHLGDVYFFSDRYFYTAGIGILLILGTLFATLMHRSKTKTVGAALFGLALISAMFVSAEQSFLWRNTDTLFAHVLELYPNSQVAHLTIGNKYQRDGDLTRAFSEYNTALQIRPTSLTYFNIGKALLGEGKLDEAIEANKRALALDPALAIAEVNLGVAYVKKDMPAQATEAFSKAVELNPDSVEAHFNLGAMEEKQQHWQQAVSEYERALELDPELVAALQHLATIANAAGNVSATQAYVTRILQLDPANKTALGLQRK